MTTQARNLLMDSISAQPGCGSCARRDSKIAGLRWPCFAAPVSMIKKTPTQAPKASERSLRGGGGVGTHTPRRHRRVFISAEVHWRGPRRVTWAHYKATVPIAHSASSHQTLAAPC